VALADNVASQAPDADIWIALHPPVGVEKHAIVTALLEQMRGVAAEMVVAPRPDVSESLSPL
jgi:hypothetical protein